MTMIKDCLLAVSIGSIALIIYAFYHIFQLRQNNENDLNVIQRQLRGFALLILTNFLTLFLIGVCAAGNKTAILDMFKKYD